MGGAGFFYPLPSQEPRSPPPSPHKTSSPPPSPHDPSWPLTPPPLHEPSSPPPPPHEPSSPPPSRLGGSWESAGLLPPTSPELYSPPQSSCYLASPPSRALPAPFSPSPPQLAVATGRGRGRGLEGPAEGRHGRLLPGSTSVSSPNLLWPSYPYLTSPPPRVQPAPPCSPHHIWSPLPPGCS